MILTKALEYRGYQTSEIARQIDRARAMDRKSALEHKEKTPNTRIPLIVTYNQNLPDFNKIINSSWNILQINATEKEKFGEKPRLTFKRNQNLKDILGQTRILNGKVQRKKIIIGECKPCRGRSDAKCCKHIRSTKTFSNQTGTKDYKKGNLSSRLPEMQEKICGKS